MTADTEAMTLEIARRVLADPTANSDRMKWADDVVRWLEFGDIKAGRRCGYEPIQEQQKAAA